MTTPKIDPNDIFGDYSMRERYALDIYIAMLLADQTESDYEVLAHNALYAADALIAAYNEEADA